MKYSLIHDTIGLMGPVLLTLLLVLLNTYLTAAEDVHPDLKQIGYVTTNAVCSKVGQILKYPEDPCSYLVCDYGMNNTPDDRQRKLLTRKMPCAPGTSVPPSFNEESTTPSINPCVDNAKVQCKDSKQPVSRHRRPEGKQASLDGSIADADTNELGKNEALKMMDLVWNSIQMRFKELDHRKSLKSHPMVKVDIEQHLNELQHLWEKVRGQVATMLHRKFSGTKVRAGFGTFKKGERHTREIGELRKLWMKMWEKIRELEALELKVAGAVEPLGFDLGEQLRSMHDERIRKHNVLNKQGMALFQPKRGSHKDILHYVNPIGIREGKSFPMYNKPTGPQYVDPRHQVPHGHHMPEYHGADNHENHHHPKRPSNHHQPRHPHFQNKKRHGHLYPHVPHHSNETPHRYSSQELKYLLGDYELDHIEGEHPRSHPRSERNTNHHNHHNELHEEGRSQSPRNHPHRNRLGETHGGKSLPSYKLDRLRHRTLNHHHRVPIKSNGRYDRQRGLQKPLRPTPPLETIDEDMEMSMVPSGYGNSMPLHSLWWQMKDVLGEMMASTKEELKNIPSDEELRRGEEEEAKMRGHAREKNEQVNREHARHRGDPLSFRPQPSPPTRHQDHSSHMGLVTNEPHHRNFVNNFAGARKAGSNRGPELISAPSSPPFTFSSEPEVPVPVHATEAIRTVLTTPTMTTMRLPSNKAEFDEFNKKATDIINEKYEKAKQQWENIAQGR